MTTRYCPCCGQKLTRDRIDEFEEAGGVLVTTGAYSIFFDCPQHGRVAEENPADGEVLFQPLHLILDQGARQGARITRGIA